jgi:hypothetical protein
MSGSLSNEATTGPRLNLAVSVTLPHSRAPERYIRILPHYPRRTHKLTPDCVRRRPNKLSPTSVASLPRQRRHSDGTYCPPVVDVASACSTLEKTFVTYPCAANEQRCDAESRIQMSDNAGNTMRLVDERSALLFINDTNSNRKSYTVSMQESKEHRIVGRRGNAAGAPIGNNDWSCHLVQSATFGGIGRPSANDAGSSSTTTTAERRNALTLAVGTGGSADDGLPTIVSSLADRSRSSRQQVDYGTTLAVPTTQRRCEPTDDGKSALKKATTSQNGGSKRPSSPDADKLARRATDKQAMRTQRVKKCIGCFKSFIAFLFSTIGLTCLLVGYTIIGGFIFESIEAPNEVRLRRLCGAPAHVCVCACVRATDWPYCTLLPKTDPPSRCGSKFTLTTHVIRLIGTCPPPLVHGSKV